MSCVRGAERTRTHERRNVQGSSPPTINKYYKRWKSFSSISILSTWGEVQLSAAARECGGRQAASLSPLSPALGPSAWTTPAHVLWTSHMVPTARMQRTRRWLGALVILLALGQAHGFAPTACARHIFIAAPVANNGRTDGAHGPVMLARKVKKSGANKKKPTAKAGGKSGGGFGVSSSSGASGAVAKKAASPKASPTASLWQIVSSGVADKKRAISLLSKGADPRAKDGEGYSMLHVASRAGHADVAAMLLNAGAEVDAFGGGGAARPLHLASLGDHAETVELLLKNGADVD